MSQLLETPFGNFKLARIPDNDKNLIAWNAADRYLLNHVVALHESGDIDLASAKILIVNDAFGALTIPLAQFSCDSYGDSFVSHKAIRQNMLRHSTIDPDSIRLIKSTDELHTLYDIVLFKETKNQAFFAQQMQTIAQHIKADALIVGGIMAKNLQKNSIKSLNNSIGETQASLAWKKARLLFVKAEQKVINNSNAKQLHINSYQLDTTKELIYNHSNVFSKSKLDIGTRFFLEHLPREKDYKHIIDLGCGNGILALKMAQQYPQAVLRCIDESYMALASAQLTLEANLSLEGRDIDYIADDALSDYPANSADLIICNPPFHQQYVVGDAIAWKMFKQAKKALLKGGELWIVGNRHLAYHLKLQKLFANHRLIAANNKFVVLKAIKK